MSLKDNVFTPTLEQEKVFRRSVYGARTYQSKMSFKSSQLEDFKSGKIEYKELTDYLVDLDAISLYPSTMALNPYPIGKCFELKDAEIDEFKRYILAEKRCPRMGIYNYRIYS